MLLGCAEEIYYLTFHNESTSNKLLACSTIFLLSVFEAELSSVIAFIKIKKKKRL